MPTQDDVVAYVQSRQSPSERAAFEAALAQDDGLRAEVAAMVAVRDVLRQDAAMADKDLPRGGWARLSDRIDQEAAAAPVPMIGKPANTNRAILLTWLQVACVAIVSILGWQALQTVTRDSDAPGFVTASVGDTGPVLQIVFTDTAVLSEVSALLLDLDGRIVGGPSALGLYSVAFDNDAAREAAFLALAANDALVREVLKD